MSNFALTVLWQRNREDFDYKTYNRTYTVKFNGGIQIQASNPKEYFGTAELPNPEELLISAVSSCYMQTFLAFACKEGYIVDSYIDDATGITDKNEQGKICVTEIMLHPKIKISGPKPFDEFAKNEICTKALENCFISNSVKSHIFVEITVIPN